MQTTRRPLGQRLLRGLLKLLTIVFVLGLVALVVYLASERNARTFSLEQHGDQLVVHKGRMLPVGDQPWTPRDPALAEAYAPIPLEGMQPDPELLAATFGDRDELDWALFSVLETLARPRIASDDPKVAEKGLYYVRRMQQLPGIAQEQRATLERMQADLAWHVARYKLNQARQLLSEALSQLELASTGRTPNARRASQLAAHIVPQARQFEDMLRATLANLPTPEAAPEPVKPQGAPQPSTPAPSAPSPEPPSAAQDQDPAATEPSPGTAGDSSPSAGPSEQPAGNPGEGS